ncbi:unnamed protein product [Mytilus edulis]|uniref:Integrase catalytic domain-containing protein n=1 Tax=Mytilus edulis TaxID=6550 RepID=A0A8S3UW05_MYTED|nr:unnamed protein product [Mytilus edulis]
MDEEVNNLLAPIYYNIENPSSFSSASKLYHIVNADGKKIGYHKIKRWLNAQDNYSLQKTPRRSFKRLRVYTTGIGNLMDVDLMQVSNLSQWNSGFNFILVAIDCFSRRLWMQASKSKKGVDIAKAFEKILQSAKVDKIRSDVDGCFKSKVVQKLFKDRGVRHFVTKNEIKANYAERVIQTIKNKFYRYFTKKRTYRYIDNLQKFVKSYNATPHRSLNFIAPNDVTPENEADVWVQQYLNKKKSHDKKVRPNTKNTKQLKTEADLKRKKRMQRRKSYTYKIGSLVRIAYTRHIFNRSYSQKWTDEIFKVVRRFKKQNINIYKLGSFYNDEMILGEYYSAELQAVDKSDASLWVVEKVLKKRKRRGKTEFLCKFQGWPDKYNQYIPEEDIQSLS